jgi:SAM-dependent methyltransferase
MTTADPASTADDTPVALTDWPRPDGGHFAARWRSERGAPAPPRVQLADDTLSADQAYRLACEGTALLWHGDFQNARHLLLALARRLDRVPRRKSRASAGAAATAAVTAQAVAPVPGASFHRHRQAQAQRARVLGQVLVPLDGEHGVPLRRAPDLRLACTEAWGPPDGLPGVVSLRELLGVLGAHEWRVKGVAIAALGPAPGNRIHPHYGVFSPVRGEYVDLVATTPLPAATREAGAFDIGTGTGVLAAVLARRGVAPLTATDLDPRALACAQANLARLVPRAQVELVQADLFPPGSAGLVLCNPPWLPARPSSPLERAVYDEGSHMLLDFVARVRQHLAPGGEAWLILSDLAEHLGLRTRQQLLEAIAAAGLQVLDRRDTRPQHRKAGDSSDPLHEARVREVTSLWRLGATTA